MGDHGNVIVGDEQAVAGPPTPQFTHVPLVCYAPGRITPRVIDEVASQVDILTTVLDSLDISATHHAIGTSLRRVCTTRHALTNYSFAPKITVTRFDRFRHWYAFGTEMTSLYDASCDYNEKHDIKSNYPKLAKAYTDDARAIQKFLGDLFEEDRLCIPPAVAPKFTVNITGAPAFVPRSVDDLPNFLELIAWIDASNKEKPVELKLLADVFAMDMAPEARVTYMQLLFKYLRPDMMGFMSDEELRVTLSIINALRDNTVAPEHVEGVCRAGPLVAAWAAEGSAFRRSFARSSKKRIAFMMPTGRMPETWREMNIALLVKSLNRDLFDVVAFCRPGPLGEHLQAHGITVHPISTFAPETDAFLPYLRLTQVLDKAFDAEMNGVPTLNVKPLVDALNDLAYRATKPPPLACLPKPVIEDGFHLADLPSGAPLPEGFITPRDGVYSLMLGRDVVRIRRAVEATRPDMVVFDAMWDAITGSLALQGTDVDCVWYVQETGIPLPWDRVACARSRRIITGGKTVANQRFQDWSQVSVAQNGVDVQLYRPRRPNEARHPFFQHVPDDEAIIGVVASMQHRQGYDVLVEACGKMAQRCAKFQVYFFGEVPEDEKNTLKTMASRYGIGHRLHFAGYRRDLSHLLPHLDLSVLSSRDEGLPLPLCEAMACGVPCVATRLPGVEELVGDNPAALLVPPDDSNALAAAMTLFMEKDNVRKILAKNGRDLVENKFTSQHMVQAFEEALKTTGAPPVEQQRLAAVG